MRAYILVVPVIIIVLLSVCIDVQGIADAQTTTVRPLQPGVQVVPIQISTNTPLQLIKQWNNTDAWAIDGDSQGDLYFESYSSYSVAEEIYANGTVRTLDSGFIEPRSITVDSQGNVYVADNANFSNWGVEIYPNGTMRALENPAPGVTSAYGIGVDSWGNVYILCSNNSIMETYTNGTIRTLATGLVLYSIAVDPQGNMYGVQVGNDSVVEVYNNGTVRTLATGFYAPQDAAVDSQGNVYVADSGDNWVVEIYTNGTITTLGSGFNWPTQVAVDSLGDLYVSYQDDNGDPVISEFAPVSPIHSQSSEDNSSPVITATPVPMPSQSVSITATPTSTPTITPMQTATPTAVPSSQVFSAWWIVGILAVIVVAAGAVYFFIKR